MSDFNAKVLDHSQRVLDHSRKCLTTGLVCGIGVGFGLGVWAGLLLSRFL